MRIALPKERKCHEYRVALTPVAVSQLTKMGHFVSIECAAGEKAGFNDDLYVAAGAKIVQDWQVLWAEADLIIKVKEPLPDEALVLHSSQALFSYLHLAVSKTLAEQLLSSGATCIAYETIKNEFGALPLLVPMSEVAGRMAIQAAGYCLQVAHGGSGVLLGGLTGVAPAHVVVLGAGVVGENAARMALGQGAQVTIIDKSLARLRELDKLWQGRARTLYSSLDSIASEVKTADVVIGAALIPGAEAPKLLNRAMLKSMRKGSVLVDVAIDQGGCFETSRPTTLEQPTYIVDGIVHYCVSNIPGAVARSSTQALCNASLPYVLDLVQGLSRNVLRQSALASGVNICQGECTEQEVAKALSIEYHAL
ncbi:alanine dehydrogenase [Agaribacterium sp. ZY112]|uniref:alanine dehydrogenase n=1 Tax=Agaribacterium sp. ZY112 TaxID=3233574 RepID=UPI003523B2D7